MPENSCQRLPAGSQQARQRTESFGSEVAEQLPMRLAHRLVQPGEDVQPFLRDLDNDDTAVLAVAAARNEPALFQPVEQPRDIRIVRNHTIGDLPAGEPLGSPAKDSQNIILR